MRVLCPACRADTLTTSRGTCSVCDEPLLTIPRPRDRPARADIGRPWADPRLVELAYAEWYVRERLSIRACARRLLDQPGVFYASVESAARMLERQWRHRGYPVRLTRVGSIEARWRHGLATSVTRSTPEGLAARRERARRTGLVRGVPCAATTRAGGACRRPALAGGRYCVAHDPERHDSLVAALAAARSRSGVAR